MYGVLVAAQRHDLQAAAERYIEEASDAMEEFGNYEQIDLMEVCCLQSAPHIAAKLGHLQSESLGATQLL